MQGLSHACSLHLLRSLAHRPRGSPPGVGRACLSVEAGRCRPVIFRVHCGRYGISQRKSPRYVLVGPWPWRGSMSGANLRKHNATPDTYLTRPNQNILRACTRFYSFMPHGATRNDMAMVTL